MANYWMEDYESGEWPFNEHYNGVLSKCKEILQTEPKVRIGYVMFEIFNLREASKADLVSVAAGLEETGKYICRLIKYENSSDFIVTKVPKKSLKERYWLIADIIKLVVGAAIGFAASKLFHI